MLGGLLAHQLLRTAMRTSGPVPVVLALDEMGVSEGFLGTALCQILAIARSRHLRLLVACQHLAQLSDELRTALLANTAVQSFFRLGHADARLVAASLSAGVGERVSRIAVDVAKRDSDGLPETWAEVTHTIRDGYGDALKLSAPAWAAFKDVMYKDVMHKDRMKQQSGREQVAALKRLAAVSGVERLYVHAPDSQQPQELGKYIAGLLPEEYWILGAAPIRLIVSFPKPKLSVVSRQSESERQQVWTRTLMGLPVRQAVLRLAGDAPGKLAEPGVVQVVDVPDIGKPPGFERFVSAAVAGSGQSIKEIEQTQRWRRDQVERVAGNSTVNNGIETPAAPDWQSGRARKPSPSAGNGAQPGKLQPAKLQPGKRQPRKGSATTSPSSAYAMALPTNITASNVPVEKIAVGTVGEDGSLA